MLDLTRSRLVGVPTEDLFNASQADQQPIAVRMWVIVRVRWRFVAAGLLAGLAAGIVYLATTPPRFQSEAQVLIDSRTNAVSAHDNAGGASPLEIPEVESQVELIRSAKIVGSALKTLPPPLIASMENEKAPLVARLLGILGAVKRTVVEGLFGAPPEGPPDDVNQSRIDDIRGRIDVRRVGSSYVVEVGANAQSAALAAALANAVADAYVREQIEAKSVLWRGASDWLQQRLVGLREQADGAARVAQQFKADNQIIDTGAKGLVNDQQLQEINTALLEARAKTIEASAKLDQIHKLMASGVDSNMSDTSDEVLTRLRQQLADLAQRHAQLEAQLGPNHDAVRKLALDMLGISITIRDELGRVEQGLKSNYEIAAARQKSLESAFRELVDQSSVTNKALVRSRELDRTSEAYQALYTGLLQRYTDAVDQQSFPIATAQVITQAPLPSAPSGPRKLLSLLCGAVFGIGIGVAAAFAREASDSSISDPAQVERLGIPCCAILPVMEREIGFDRLLEASLSGTAGSLPITASRFKAEFLRYLPDSQYAHSVQAMKTHLVVSGLTQMTKVIGITSSQSGEGKSTVAGNLAHLFASPNRRTLLIDADIYHPSLSQAFGASERPGLTDVLVGAIPLAQAIFHVQNSDLHILSAGRPVANGHGDLLGSEQMRIVLEDVRAAFDAIIVDLPPVGEIAATREATPHLDGVVLVATWRRTSLPMLRNAIRAFDFDRNKLLGVALNRAAASLVGSPGTYAGYQARMRSRASA